MTRHYTILAFIIISLLALVSMPATLQAHDDDIAQPDGLVAPPPPVLPTPQAGQTLYHIDSSRSDASYAVQEIFVGFIDGKQVFGRTDTLFGSILVDWDNPAHSQLGMITVNVEQLTSDSRQRDRQIRQGYLESTLYPEATFIPEAAQTFPATITPGDSVNFTLHGFLTVRDITALADWEVALTIDADKIRGTATTDVLMSDFGVGPISIAGFLTTNNAMQLSLDFVAVADGTTVAEPSAEPEAPAMIALADEATFSSSVLPIIERKCAGCHVEGEIGHSIYPMETVADIINYAADIGLVVQSGYMPPWPPSEKAPEFLHDRSLSTAERDQLLGWVAAGAPSDLSAETALTASPLPAVQVREDIRLTMPEPYVPAGDATDDYRCFLLDPQLSDGGYVTASNILPGEGRVVHHAFIFQVSADSRAEAEQKSAEDSRFGWECYGDTNLSTASVFAISDSLGAWVPGSQPLAVRDGTGLFIEPGNLFVLQIHYNYEAGYLPDQSSIVLQTESAEADLAPVRGISLVGPVEVPCPAGIDTPQCDRDAVLDEAGFEFRVLADGVLARCDQTLADYDSNTVDNAPGVCDSRVPVDGELTQVFAHMHTLGKSIRVELNPDSPNPQIIQDIPHWDFNWQDSYSLAEPIAVVEGDILRITCVYDNSKERDPANFRRVIYGSGTNDEMCLAVLKVEPTAEYAGISVDAMMAESLTTVPQWLPTVLKTPAFILSILPSSAYLVALLVVGTLITLFVRWRRRRRTRAAMVAS